MSDSEFVSHLPCLACGSSDANALYSDGHTFCWKCRAYKHGDGQVSSERQHKPRMPSQLIGPVEIKALNKRRLDQDTCAKFGYGVASYEGQTVQVAPYYDKDGALVAQKLRFPNKTFKILGDFKLAELFGQRLWRDGGKKLVITEGELDAMSVSKLQGNKWPVVSIPSGAPAAKSAIRKALDWLESFEEVVFMFDNDDEGRKAAQECALILSPGKAKIATLPLKDASDMLQADRGKEVIDAIWGAKTYRPDGIVAGEDVWSRMHEAQAEPIAFYPHQALSEKTLGLHPGELVTITAGTGSGKSTFCRELAWSIITAGIVVGYVALEEPVSRSALGLCSIALNKPLHLDRAAASKEDLRRAFDSFAGRIFFYDHFGSLEFANLEARIRYMVKACGAQVIILDHLSIVVSGLEDGDERRNIDIAMTRLASLAQETGACIVLVSHLKRADGKPHEEGRPVSLADLRGSQAIAQLSHTIIALERDQQSETEKHLVTARLLKCRLTGETGLCGHLQYHRETGRMTETTVAFDTEAQPPAEGSDY